MSHELDEEIVRGLCNLYKLIVSEFCDEACPHADLLPLIVKLIRTCAGDNEELVKQEARAVTAQIMQKFSDIAQIRAEAEPEPSRVYVRRVGAFTEITEEFNPPHERPRKKSGIAKLFRKK